MVKQRATGMKCDNRRNGVDLGKTCEGPEPGDVLEGVQTYRIVDSRDGISTGGDYHEGTKTPRKMGEEIVGLIFVPVCGAVVDDADGFPDEFVAAERSVS